MSFRPDDLAPLLERGDFADLFLEESSTVTLRREDGRLDEASQGRSSGAGLRYVSGAETRFGVLGSALGVHRFVTTRPVNDPVAEAQRISGAVLGYMTKMGVSSSIVEAMSETREIRWLSPKQALAMNLVTDPLGKP